MKKLDYNKNSWHAKIYQSTYGEGLPDNICAYFWKLLYAILMAIPNYPSHIMNIINKEYEYKACWAWLHIVMLLGIGCAILNKPVAVNIGFLAKAYLCGIVILFAFLVALFGAIFLSDRFSFSFKRKSKDVIKTPNPLIEGFKAFKGKYCTKINWK